MARSLKYITVHISEIEDTAPRKKLSTNCHDIVFTTPNVIKLMFSKLEMASNSPYFVPECSISLSSIYIRMIFPYIIMCIKCIEKQGQCYPIQQTKLLVTLP